MYLIIFFKDQFFYYRQKYFFNVKIKLSPPQREEKNGKLLIS
jgi:hypothetical protein